jgi:DNA adenine methylase
MIAELLDQAQPFLKWAGGKRKLVPLIKSLMPYYIHSYHEPFLGAGSLALNISHQNGYLSLLDINPELINCWRMVREHHLTLIAYLQNYERMEWTAARFIELRNADRNGEMLEMSPCARAARFIVINKIGFNGLWRESKAGFCNTSYGHKKKLVVNYGQIKEAARVLKGSSASIWCLPWQEAIELSRSGDFIYADPPYLPMSATASFANYSADGFSVDDHKELAAALYEGDKRSVRWMVSGNDSELYRQIYAREIAAGTYKEIEVGRSISCNGADRKPVKELLIYNYTPPS